MERAAYAASYTAVEAMEDHNEQCSEDCRECCSSIGVTATAASAKVVCNEDGNCWRAKTYRVEIQYLRQMIREALAEDLRDEPQSGLADRVRG